MRFTAFLLLFLLHAAAAQAEPLKIAVLPFDNAVGPQMAELADAMPDIITACFTPHSDAAQLLERGMLEGLTGEQALQYGTALGKGEKPSRPSALFAATHILRGSLAPHDNGFTLNLMLYDLATQALVAGAEAHGSEGDVAAVSCRATDTLAEKLPGLKSPSIQTPTANADETAQWLDVTEAMGFYYNGAFEKAIASFLRLSKEKPEDGAMRYWLAKSYLGAGMKDLAALEFRSFVEAFPKHVRAPEGRGELKKLMAEQEKEDKKSQEKKP